MKMTLLHEIVDQDENTILRFFKINEGKEKAWFRIYQGCFGGVTPYISNFNNFREAMNLWSKLIKPYGF